MVNDSPASAGVPGAQVATHHLEEKATHGDILGMDPHKAMFYISAVVGFIGIGFAFFFHLLNRKAADSLRSKLLASRTTRWLPTAMENKWYVDEIYIGIIRTPLWITGKIFTLFDRYIIDMLIVNGIASLPRVIARWFSPLHNGSIQSYGVSMIGGVLLVALLMLFMPQIVELLQFLASASTQEGQVVMTGGIQ